MDQHYVPGGLDVTWPGSLSLITSLATSTAAPANNCSHLDDNSDVVCNITACNFGNGCVIDFSTMDMNPWRVMEPWRLAVFGVGLGVTTIPGIIGNIFVISIVLGNKIMQNEINMFILNMAVADLIASIVLPPTFMVTNVFQAYQLGPWWCKYGSTVRLTLLLTSVFSISVISVDRLRGLMRPFHRQIPPMAIRAIMISTWVVAGAIAFYPAQFNKYSKRQYHDFLDIMCEQTDIKRMRVYWWVICVFLIWVPALILFTCFVVIFIRMRRFSVNNKKSSHRRFVSPVTRGRQRAVRLVFAMFVTFFICWTPFLLYVLLYQFAEATHDNGKVWEYLYYTSHFMMHLVPVINPILYALLHENFRRAATVTCPWLPSKVKYKAFQTGHGSRVQWSQRTGGRSSVSTVQTSTTTTESQRSWSQILRCLSPTEVSSDGHQSGAAVATPSSPSRPRRENIPMQTLTEAEVTTQAESGAESGVESGTESQTAMEEGNNGKKISGEKLSDVSLIWNALMERQRQRLDQLSPNALPGITEESDSRKSSIRSSIDLNEVTSPPGVTTENGLRVSEASGHSNVAFTPH